MLIMEPLIGLLTIIKTLQNNVIHDCYICLPNSSLGKQNLLEIKHTRNS